MSLFKNLFKVLGPNLKAYMLAPATVHLSANETAPAVSVQSHSIVIRNDGFDAAKDVIIKHDFSNGSREIPSYNIIPKEIHFREEGKALIFPSIEVGQQVQISYIYFLGTTAKIIHLDGLSINSGAVKIKDSLKSLHSYEAVGKFLFLLFFSIFPWLWIFYSIYKAYISH